MTSILNHGDRFFIDGEWKTPTTTDRFDVVNPATEKLFLQVPAAHATDMEYAVNAARRAFDEGPWPLLSHADRAAYLRAMADEIERRTADLSLIWTSEMGILHSASKAATPVAASIFCDYAALAETFPFEERKETRTGGAVGLLTREPVGVVAAIIPWNGPLLLAAYKIAPALLAGCTIVLKAAPEAPGAAYLLAEIAQTIGLPRGVLNVLTADREVSESLVRHASIDKVTFTGSSGAGKKIASICGERVARCTLELGGKSAAIVLDDYDIGDAAKKIASATTYMTGQVCAALTRIIVPGNRHETFVEALAAEFGKIRVGDPFADESEMGPLAMARQRARVEAYIEEGRRQGGVIAAGGGRPAHLDLGYYFEPTVFARVTNNMTIAREEIFGPVVCVIQANDEDDAVRIANASDFGLNGSVFTNDVERAYGISRRLRTGTVGQNDFRSDFSIGFGGFKQSGIGREGGRDGLLPFLESKTIILDAEPTHLR
ncbi:aldehyde dehydrogenase [Sphingobium lactosutens]|uniref:aldehyde dehydrogenase n=1 Tax=Sphingobium lactosutens TaxID=522773 RepID=UPI0015BF6D30|nr:aldehyde dehydrogenase [Sphingobium lactosutens]NWK94446.1 aldehyde dehydrogenase [Sphingobium lactosutens]